MWSLSPAKMSGRGFPSAPSMAAETSTFVRWARAFEPWGRVRQRPQAKRFHMLYDHRGSAHVLLDESKDIVATRLYNAFGEMVSETGTWPDEVPFGYQSNWLALDGMTLPDGTRLYFSPTRVYHPGVGRFLQRDPIGVAADMNLYVVTGRVKLGHQWSGQNGPPAKV